MGSIEVKDSEEFRRLMQALALDVDYARIHWRMQRDLWNALDAHPWVRRNSPAFWSLTLKAHQESALMALCRAFDSHSGALSLSKWLGVIRDHLHLFDVEAFDARMAAHPFLATIREHAMRPDAALLASDMRRCSVKDPAVEKLIVFRGNVTAHRSMLGALHGDTQERAPPPMFVEIEELLERAGEVLNTYSRLFSAESFSASMVGSQDYAHVIKTLASAVDEYEKRLAAEFKRAGIEPEFLSDQAKDDDVAAR